MNQNKWSIEKPIKPFNTDKVSTEIYNYLLDRYGLETDLWIVEEIVTRTIDHLKPILEDTVDLVKLLEVENIIEKYTAKLFEDEIKIRVINLLSDIDKIENDTKMRISSNIEGGIKVYSSECIKLVKDSIKERFKDIIGTAEIKQEDR